MTKQKMGKWTNPPLAYVVAEVGISPHYSLAQSIPAIQQGLRSDYPRTLDGIEFSVEMGGAVPAPVSQSVWQLLTADAGRGVNVATRAIALHATQYDDFAKFADQLLVVLRAIEESKLNPFVERLGLRYIDFILPSEGNATHDYLVAALHGVRPVEARQLQSSMWVAALPVDECIVNARIAAPAPPGMVMPPNFSALPLAKPKTLLEAEERVKAGQQVGFIDTDCTMAAGMPFAADQLAEKFRGMHEHISSTFKSFMSDLAKREWI